MIARNSRKRLPTKIELTAKAQSALYGDSILISLCLILDHAIIVHHAFAYLMPLREREISILPPENETGFPLSRE